MATPEELKQQLKKAKQELREAREEVKELITPENVVQSKYMKVSY